MHAGEPVQRGYFHLSLEELLEVEVRAQKHAQELEEIPGMITVVPGEVADSPLVDNLSDLAERVPALTVSSYNDATPQLYMRGIGSNLSGAADDPTVSVLYDGAYLSRANYHELELFDLDRIEILHGPQSGIFGKNVIGGLLSVRPKRPGFEDEHALEVHGGSKHFLGTSGHSNVSLFEDRVGQRFSFSLRQRDGYLDNSVTGNELDDYESWSLREQLMWSPSGDVDRSVRLSATFQDYRANGPAVQSEFDGPNPFAPHAGDSEHTDVPTDGDNVRRCLLTVLDANWPLARGHVRSQSNFLSGSIDFDRPLFAFADARVANTAAETTREFSQELSWSAGDSGDPLRGRIGAYFGVLDVARDESYEFAEWYELIGRGGELDAARPGNSYFDSDVTAKTGALSGSLLWRFFPDFLATGGLHLSRDDKDVHNAATGGDPDNNFIDVPYDDTNDESWEGWSGRVALSWLPRPDSSLFVAANRGFKSGRFNSLAWSRTAAHAAADPEIARSAEIGGRHFIEPLRTRLSAGAYITQYENLHVYQNTADIVRAAEARIEGVEASLDWATEFGLELGVDYAYTHARYEEFVDQLGNDFSGKRMPRTPDHAVAGTLSATRELPRGQLKAGVSASYRNRTYFDPENSEAGSTKARTILDAALSYSLSNLAFMFWIKNLTDETYDLWVIDTGIPELGRASVQAPPRIFGISISSTY